MCADGLNIDESKVPQVQIKTEAQATNYVEELVGEMFTARVACNVRIPNPTEDTVKAVQRMMWVFLTKQGRVVGALNALRLAGLISERAWKELTQKAINALGPTVVGEL